MVTAASPRTCVAIPHTQPVGSNQPAKCRKRRAVAVLAQSWGMWLGGPARDAKTAAAAQTRPGELGGAGVANCARRIALRNHPPPLEPAAAAPSSRIPSSLRRASRRASRSRRMRCSRSSRRRRTRSKRPTTRRAASPTRRTRRRRSTLGARLHATHRAPLSPLTAHASAPQVPHAAEHARALGGGGGAAQEPVRADRAQAGRRPRLWRARRPRPRARARRGRARRRARLGGARAARRAARGRARVGVGRRAPGARAAAAARLGGQRRRAEVARLRPGRRRAPAAGRRRAAGARRRRGPAGAEAAGRLVLPRPRGAGAGPLRGEADL